ncbi:hypothetical protein C8J57DRAFT_1473609 [Mycena rebaudengoi]|nr:hypothetical protein C8J57DRAFT_1473609 [Mycena rebaudengoi]
MYPSAVSGGVRYGVFSPTVEQRHIIEMAKKYNVFVCAPPGTGKTALAPAMASEFPQDRLLVLTPWARSKDAIRSRLEAYPLANVHTIHSMANVCFQQYTIYDDLSLRTAFRDGGTLSWTLEAEELPKTIILDDAEDITKYMFRFICEFISLTCRTTAPPRLIVLGDPAQSVNGYRGGDSRYLTDAPEIFVPFSAQLAPWKRLKLTENFRLSLQNTLFIRDGYGVPVGNVGGRKAGEKPTYLHANLDLVDTILPVILPLIDRYGAANTAILAPFVDGNRVLQELTAALSARDILVEVAGSEDAQFDDRVLRDKLVITSFTRFKGEERDLVILFDTEHPVLHNGDYVHTKACPPPLLVALTRANKKLVQSHADFQNIISPAMPSAGPRLSRTFFPDKIAASDIGKNMDPDTLATLVEHYLGFTLTCPRSSSIEASQQVCSDSARQHYETTSGLNGRVVVAEFELTVNGSLKALGVKDIQEQLRDFAALPEGPERTIKLTQRAIAHEADRSQFPARNTQLRNHSFDWLVPDVPKALARLKAEFPDCENLEFEVPMETSFVVDHASREPEQRETRISGCADIVQESVAGTYIVHEIKFVSSLGPRHIVQAVVYCYLWARHKQMREMPGSVLFNVRDGERHAIQVGMEAAEYLIGQILIATYGAKREITTEEFRLRCDRIRLGQDLYDVESGTAYSGRRLSFLHRNMRQPISSTATSMPLAPPHIVKGRAIRGAACLPPPALVVHPRASLIKHPLDRMLAIPARSSVPPPPLSRSLRARPFHGHDSHIVYPLSTPPHRQYTRCTCSTSKLQHDHVVKDQGDARPRSRLPPTSYRAQTSARSLLPPPPLKSQHHRAQPKERQSCHHLPPPQARWAVLRSRLAFATPRQPTTQIIQRFLMSTTRRQPLDIAYKHLQRGKALPLHYKQPVTTTRILAQQSTPLPAPRPRPVLLGHRPHGHSNEHLNDDRPPGTQRGITDARRSSPSISTASASRTAPLPAAPRPRCPEPAPPRRRRPDYDTLTLFKRHPRLRLHLHGRGLSAHRNDNHLPIDKIHMRHSLGTQLRTPSVAREDGEGRAERRPSRAQVGAVVCVQARRGARADGDALASRDATQASARVRKLTPRAQIEVGVLLIPDAAARLRRRARARTWRRGRGRRRSRVARENARGGGTVSRREMGGHGVEVAVRHRKSAQVHARVCSEKGVRMAKRSQLATQVDAVPSDHVGGPCVAGTSAMIVTSSAVAIVPGVRAEDEDGERQATSTRQFSGYTGTERSRRWRETE